MIVRHAHKGDVAACVLLIEARRKRYEEYQPQFWKTAEDSASLTTNWYDHLFEEGDTLALVSERDGQVVGFLIATSFPAPPVYEPGGPNALIDDFSVEPDLWPTAGAMLLDHAKALLRNRGFVQIVVIGARQDSEKTEFLKRTDLSLASTWWTAGL